MNTESEFIIPLSTLKEGEYERKYVIKTDFFTERECEEVTEADVAVTLKIDYRNDIYNVSLLFKGNVEVPCHRCLDPVGIDIDDTLTFTIRYGESEDEGSDNVFVVSYSTRTFDIAPLIYDTILLSVPMRCVHPAGKCNPEMETLIAGEAESDVEKDDED